VAGDEEARARAALNEMLMRISQGPHSALGVHGTPTHDQVRSAFLELTKRFHPARFGRMSIDVQKLSNEVFLGIKLAHDTLAGGSSLRGRASGSGSPVRAEASQSLRPTTGSTPQPRATTGKGTPGIPPSRSPTPPYGHPTVARTTTPLHGQPAIARTPTPPAGQPAIARTPTPLAGVRAPSPAGRSPTPATKSTQTMPAVFDERTALDQALEMIRAQTWTAARQALHTLAARVPQSKQYRSLLCYTRGREAQAVGRMDEAILEFQRALQLDPDLVVAKQALAEAQRRR
jgi:hypothetical protein